MRLPPSGRFKTQKIVRLAPFSLKKALSRIFFEGCRTPSMHFSLVRLSYLDDEDDVIEGGD